MFRIAKVVVIGLMCSSPVLADDDDWDECPRQYRQEYYPAYQEEII